MGLPLGFLHDGPYLPTAIPASIKSLGASRGQNLRASAAAEHHKTYLSPPFPLLGGRVSVESFLDGSKIPRGARPGHW